MTDDYDPTQDAHDSYYAAIAELRRQHELKNKISGEKNNVDTDDHRE